MIAPAILKSYIRCIPTGVADDQNARQRSWADGSMEHVHMDLGYYLFHDEGLSDGPYSKNGPELVWEGAHAFRGCRILWRFLFHVVKPGSL